MMLVQLSDMHVGSQFQPEVFDRVVEEVNGLKPDAIVITGDLTNQGLIREYEEARRLVSRFHTRRIIAISGNHDYRNTGYLAFKKYFPFDTVNELGREAILVTLGTARPDRDGGEVGYRQNLWLERTMKRYAGRVKIVAMHHHLIGIPDTGSDMVTVIDAGDVLRTVLATGVDLVLCGHRHRPWIWNLGSLEIVNAGTVSSERVRGLFANTYNIVNVRGGKVSVDLKIVGGRTMPIEDIVKGYSPFGEERT